MRDLHEEDQKEIDASEFGLSYIALDGAVICGGKGSAQDKIAAMTRAGVRVTDSPASIGAFMEEALKDAGLLDGALA